MCDGCDRVCVECGDVFPNHLSHLNTLCGKCWEKILSNNNEQQKGE